MKTFTICEKKLDSPSASKNRKLESRHIQMSKNISLYQLISETFGVSDVTRQYIYYFQWEFWQCTFPIYEAYVCKIFKSFSFHCSLLLIMVISLNYFAIYIIQKNNSCIDRFTFHLNRYCDVLGISHKYLITKF